MEAIKRAAKDHKNNIKNQEQEILAPKKETAETVIIERDENNPGRFGEYPKLLAEIKERIRSAQYEALKKVNKALVGLYWDIGRMIVERQENEGWGKFVVKWLSADLRQEFPGVSGFSVQNLWYMRQFYSESECHDNERLQPLVGEIAWVHNLVIMGKCKVIV